MSSRNCDIFDCACHGRLYEATVLLREDPTLAGAVSSEGMTALHYAARSGHIEVARVLIDAGADANARDNDGGTALLEACHAGPWKREPAADIIELLLKNGAEIDLHSAAAIGRVEVVESLLDGGENVGGENIDGAIDGGAYIDQLNARSETAIFLAAKNNQVAVARLLVERGADINLADAVGIAALHRTSQECSDELIRFLIENGADAHLCCYVACGDVKGTQQSLEENPNAANEIFYEYSAVGYAIHSWQLETLRLLLQSGSALTEEDRQHILRISGNDQELLTELTNLS